jgi:hypothetical protein
MHLIYKSITGRFDMSQALPPYRIDVANDSMTIWADEGGNKVRWASLNALKTPTQVMHRVIAWTADGIDAPHLVIERGSLLEGADRTEGIGTMTLLPRADLVIDRAYHEKYYGGAFDAIANECARRTTWRRYVPARLDAKPLLAHSICYTFREDDPAEDAFFDKQAMAIARWWMNRVENADAAAEDKESKYDCRYRQGIIDDGDVSLVASMFGAEAASIMVGMTLG